MNKFEEYINSEIPIKKELETIFRMEDPLVIFDIGACEGEDSIRYNYLFKNAAIYSFEPLPENFDKCIINFSKDSFKRIRPFQLALSSSNGVAKFYVSSGSPEGKNRPDWDYGNKSSSLYSPDASYKKNEWLKFEKEIEVKKQTISSFCLDQSIQKVDFIHMDVQGAELDVLIGAETILSSIKAIWLEVENVSMYEGQPLKKDIEKFMKKMDFIKIKDTAFGDSGDQLYLNSMYSSKFKVFIIKSIILINLKHIYSDIIHIKNKIKKYIIN